MFRSARIKLTAWYVLILMSVCVFFSIVIFQVLIREVERFSRVQRFRIDRRHEGDTDLVQEAENRILVMLVIVNGSILTLSSLLAYLLAGKTLQPIKNMVEEQYRFVTDASHELRTPLTSLKTAMEVHLRDPHLKLSEAKELIESNIKDVNKLQSLSDSLLQLAIYQNSPSQELWEYFDLRKEIEEVISKFRAIAQNKEIKLIDTTEPIGVYGMKQSLKDLVTILLDNSIKYSEAKGVVEIKTTKNDKGITLTVKDEGMGISANDLPHIFERFYRADKARSHANTGGYGLGLAIAKRIVDQHKGTINAESELGKGTRFIVYLPQKKGQPK